MLCDLTSVSPVLSHSAGFRRSSQDFKSIFLVTPSSFEAGKPPCFYSKKNWSKKWWEKVEICGKISDGFQFSLKRLRDRTYKVIRSFFISTNVSQVKNIWAYCAYFRIDTNVYGTQYQIRNVGRKNQNILAIFVMIQFS